MTDSIPIEPIWEHYANSTKRLLVDGGHIYAIEYVEGITTTFVPDIDLTRYQAHLRDAYKAGYKDGLEDGNAGYTKPRTETSGWHKKREE
jgi:hypothetical protein